MNLRPYQIEAVNRIRAEWDRVNKTLLVLPTGCGKTIVFCKLAEMLVSEGDRILILAHRGELLDQAADKMKKATGLGCSVEKAEETSIGEWFRITVGSIQTLMRENRLAKFRPDHFDIIIVDEAHHALSDSYQRVLNHFSDAKVLGVTATPDRGDLRNLGGRMSRDFRSGLTQAAGVGPGLVNLTQSLGGLGGLMDRFPQPAPVPGGGANVTRPPAFPTGGANVTPPQMSQVKVQRLPGVTTWNRYGYVPPSSR
jgi:hypothetical protein